MITHPTKAPDRSTSKKKFRITLDVYRSSLRRCGKRELVLMLAAIKARIGTSGDYPEDRARSDAICQRLKNIHFGAYLHESIRKMDSGYRSV